MDPTLSLGRELTCTVRPRTLLFSSSPAHRYLLTQTVADWGEMLPPGRPGIAHALNLLQRQLGSIKARIEITRGDRYWSGPSKSTNPSPSSVPIAEECSGSRLPWGDTSRRCTRGGDGWPTAASSSTWLIDSLNAMYTLVPPSVEFAGGSSSRAEGFLPGHAPKAPLEPLPHFLRRPQNFLSLLLTG